MAPHRHILAVSALFCIGTAVFFFLIAPAAAGGGVVEGDCTCSLSGVAAATWSAGSTELECTWTKSGGSASYPA